MIVPLIFAIVAILLLLSLLWTVSRLHSSRAPRASGILPELESLFPLHCRYFPQVQQALSESDVDYLKLRADSKARRRVLAQRRAVVREFLVGLREDFQRIDQLGRAIAALSPEVHRVDEWMRLRQTARFEILCLRVQLRLLLNGFSVPALKRLADLVGAQAAQMEGAIAAIQELSVKGTRPDFSF